jgi:hypothetical protein
METNGKLSFCGNEADEASGCNTQYDRPTGLRKREYNKRGSFESEDSKYERYEDLDQERRHVRAIKVIKKTYRKYKNKLKGSCGKMLDLRPVKYEEWETISSEAVET